MGEDGELHGCVISISMAISTQSINRVTISDLPSAQSIKDDDFLILQSDGVSSKIQVSDLKFDRANLTFYNEIVDLNRVTAEHTADISTLKQSLSITNDTNSQTRIDNLETEVETLKTTVSELTTKLDTLQTSLSSTTTSLNDKVAGFETDLATNSALIATNNAALSEDVAGAENRLMKLETNQTELVDVAKTGRAVNASVFEDLNIT